jgi:hypothetical protein
MEVKEVGYEDVDPIHLAYGPVESLCEYGKEPSRSINAGNSLQLSDSQFLRRTLLYTVS